MMQNQLQATLSISTVTKHVAHNINIENISDM